MEIRLPCGPGTIRYDAPDNAAVIISKVEELRSMRSGTELVREALAAPIGAAPLRELAKGKKTCTVIISDHTRPVPSRDILPSMLEELRAGNPELDITLLVATGCHRPTSPAELEAKLGAEIFSREKIVIHDCDRNNIPIGVLPSGAPLVIDRLAAETDLLVAEGFIEPHFFAGFSGGRKSVLPGVCDRKTVLGNHCGAFIASPFARTGVLEGNPIHRDMIAAARMAKLAFIVNVVVDTEHRTAAAFAGDPERAHLAGCEFLRELCVVDAVPADLVVITNGGAPMDQNIYQCVKGMTAAEATAKPGAVIIQCAECADGVGGDDFYRSLRDCKDAASLYAEITATPQSETIPDQWESQILVRVLKEHPVIMVTREELADTVREMKMRYAPTLEDALAQAAQLLPPDPEVTVIPNGIAVMVRPVGQA